jgi:hypothetical protein
MSKAAALRGNLTCIPSYLNREGLRFSEDQAIALARIRIWGEEVKSYIKEIEAWRKKGGLVGFKIQSR